MLIRSRRFVTISIVFTIWVTFLIFKGYSYLGTPDDPYLCDFLLHGFNATHILSYPASTLLVKLYHFFPNIQWMSWLYFFGVEVCVFLIAYYLEKLSDPRLKLIGMFFGFIILTYVMVSINVTIITLTIMALALPLVRLQPVVFWVLMVLASLYRDSIVLNVLPLLIVAYLLSLDRYFPVRIQVFSAVAAIAAMATIIWSQNLDENYVKWMKFNDARSYFKDFNGYDSKGVLSQDELQIVRSWFIQDDALVSTEKVIAAAGTPNDMLIKKVLHLSIYDILRLIKHNPIFIILFMGTLYYLYRYEKRWSRRILYMAFAGGLFMLLILRNVDRVIVPMYLMWLVLLWYDFLNKKEKKVIMSIAVFFSVALVFKIFGIVQKNSIKSLYNSELRTLLVKPYRYEVAIGFPQRVTQQLIYALSANRLFDEKNWISNFILPAGWMARHPYFYESHDITAYGVKRNFPDYYQFALHENTVFIGSEKINFYLTGIVLKRYNKLFGKNGKCLHKVQYIDSSKNFSLVKFFKECNEDQQ